MLGGELPDHAKSSCVTGTVKTVVQDFGEGECLGRGSFRAKFLMWRHPGLLPSISLETSIQGSHPWKTFWRADDVGAALRYADAPRTGRCLLSGRWLQIALGEPCLP